MRVLLVVTLAVFATSAIAQDAPKERLYDCDGEDEFLLKEIDEAFKSGVGYGETWDDSVCEEGLLDVYAQGANSRWPAFKRPKKPVAPAPAPLTIDEAKAQKANDQFFALAMPIFGFGAFFMCIAIAAVIGVFLRLRKQILLDVACPVCKTNLPFIVGESPQLFCPRCGGACRVDVEIKGKLHSATAIPL